MVYKENEIKSRRQKNQKFKKYFRNVLKYNNKCMKEVSW